MIATISLYVTSIPTIHCRAGESQGFYTSEDLQAAQKLYSSRVIGNFQKIILPLIQPEKANALRDVEFDFPLGVPSQEPMSFFSHDRKITMSVHSIRFWQDIVTAETWLRSHGYSLETVSDYFLVLKYHKYTGNPPAPLKALCIPPEATEDNHEEVGATMARMVNFIALHELGHIYLHHNTAVSTLEESREREIAADQFALNATARIGELPDVVTFFTDAATMALGRGDFATPEAYTAYVLGRTHPLDSERLKNIARDIELETDAYAFVQGGSMGKNEWRDKIQKIADGIADLSDRIDDYRTHDIWAGRAAVLDEDSLGPRKDDEIELKSCLPKNITSNGKEFSGPYQGEIIYNLNKAHVMTNCNGTRIPTHFDMSRLGDHVNAHLIWGPGPGKIEGLLEQNQLHFRLNLPFRTGPGKGVLWLKPNGDLEGTWGAENSETDGGCLTLTRAPQQ